MRSRDLWRVFPWDRDATPGQPFSPSYVPPNQGSGRFDLITPPVLYLAESAEHAVAERIGRYRGTALRDYHLREFGERLAFVVVRAPERRGIQVVDLCDPDVLARHGIRPDTMAARDVTVSQSEARKIHQAGFAGFRWWSSYFGEWHTVVLFLDRVDIRQWTFGEPDPLTTQHPSIRAAATALDMKIA